MGKGASKIIHVVESATYYFSTIPADIDHSKACRELRHRVCHQGKEGCCIVAPLTEVKNMACGENTRKQVYRIRILMTRVDSTTRTRAHTVTLL